MASSETTVRRDTDHNLEAAWPASKCGAWTNEESRAGWVSVIIPTFNRASFLPKTLDSVYRQEYRPVELVLVDDGSTDDTESVVTRWADAHRGPTFDVRYLYQENSGPSAARNLGILRSEGEYLQFLDSDDRLHPQKLSVQVTALEKEPPCDLVLGENVQYNLPDEDPIFNEYDSDRLVEESPRYEIGPASLLGGNLVNGLYRRSLCAEAGPMHEGLSWMEDVEYSLRVSAVASFARRIDAPFLAFGRHGGDHLTGVRRTRKGLDKGLMSTSAMEQTLDALAIPSGASARGAVADFYMRMARLALRVGSTSGFNAAVSGALRNRTSRSFRLKVKVLRHTRRVIGDTATRAIWNRVAGFNPA
jgi:glycosyltransferase involved in cell wall biosynthesis